MFYAVFGGASMRLKARTAQAAKWRASRLECKRVMWVQAGKLEPLYWEKVNGRWVRVKDFFDRKIRTSQPQRNWYRDQEMRRRYADIDRELESEIRYLNSERRGIW